MINVIPSLQNYPTKIKSRVMLDNENVSWVVISATPTSLIDVGCSSITVTKNLSFLIIDIDQNIRLFMKKYQHNLNVFIYFQVFHMFVYLQKLISMGGFYFAANFYQVNIFPKVPEMFLSVNDSHFDQNEKPQEHFNSCHLQSAKPDTTSQTKPKQSVALVAATDEELTKKLQFPASDVL